MGLGVEQGRSGWGILSQPGGPLESDLRAEPRVCEELRETQKTGQKGRGWAWAQPGHWLRVPGLTLVVQTLPSLPSLPQASWGLIVPSAHLHQMTLGFLATRQELMLLTCEVGQTQDLARGVSGE